MPVRLQLDMISDVTILPKKTWKLLGSPALTKCRQVARSASGSSRKLPFQDSRRDYSANLRSQGVILQGRENVVYEVNVDGTKTCSTKHSGNTFVDKPQIVNLRYNSKREKCHKVSRHGKYMCRGRRVPKVTIGNTRSGEQMRWGSLPNKTYKHATSKAGVKLFTSETWPLAGEHEQANY
ncbi:hypothetical protein CSKR_107345, partial [Clonorchis sinensis]